MAGTVVLPAFLACQPARDSRPSAAPPSALLPVPPAGPAWSPVVDGVRGRLIATPSRERDGRPQVRLDLELENVSDRGAPIELWWAGLHDALQLTLEDEAGTALPQNGVGGNSLDPSPYWLALPYRSAIRFTISEAAYEYVPSGRTMLRPLSLTAWDVARDHAARLYLGGRFFVPPPRPEVGPHGWSGPLALPRVAIP